MRVLTWNIRAGGGKRIEPITTQLLAADADIVVLTEYRPKPCQSLLKQFEGAGYSYLAGEPDGPHNSVCILSKSPLRFHPCSTLPKSIHRWISVIVDDGDLVILGVHVPNVSEIWNKREFLECINSFVLDNLDRPAMVIGDLNTCRDEDCEGAFIGEAVYFNRYLDQGWVDAWRHLYPDGREFTWYSHKKNGFRLDHCLISPVLLARLNDANYRHDVREAGLSDHSWMCVEFG